MSTHPKIGVLGAGVWGAALSLVLAKKNNEVFLWDHHENLINILATTRHHPHFPKEIVFPSNIHCCTTIRQVVDPVDSLLIVVPSHAFPQVVFSLKSIVKDRTPILWATKGMSPEGTFLHEVAMEALGPDRPYALLSGPSFALEVAEGKPTAVMLASFDENFAKSFAQRFHQPNFQILTTDDVIGVELGNVVKNVLAVVAGISDGLNLGANARAALITEGLNELMQLGDILGAKRQTLMGLAGLGDIILTCTDNQSRNRRFGLLLATGLTEAEALEKIGQAVEAVYNVQQVCQLARIKGVKLPISEQVFGIMKHQLPPKQALLSLFDK